MAFVAVLLLAKRGTFSRWFQVAQQRSSGQEKWMGPEGEKDEKKGP